MFVAGAFPDTYDLYRPTVSVSGSGVEKSTISGTATSEGLACRFLPKPKEAQPSDTGAEPTADAAMLIPVAHTLYPEKKDETPDWLHVDSKWYLVTLVYAPSNNSMFKRVLLRERRTP